MKRIPLYRCEKAGECKLSACPHNGHHEKLFFLQRRCPDNHPYYRKCVHVGYRVEPHDTPMREEKE